MSLYLCRFLHFDLYRHSQPGQHVYERVETKEINLSFEQGIQPRLGDPEALGPFRLSQAAAAVAILHAHHQERPQLEVFSLFLGKPEIEKYVAAATSASQFRGHLRFLSWISVLKRNRASSISGNGESLKAVAEPFERLHDLLISNMR
jgi:hypothetical protein